MFVEAREVVIPAGRADDHRFAGADAGFDVGDDRGWVGEVDDGIELGEGFGGEGGGLGVVGAAESLDVMAAFTGDFGDLGAGFALAEDEELHVWTFHRRDAEGAERF